MKYKGLQISFFAAFVSIIFSYAAAKREILPVALKPAFSYTCTYTDYDKITDVSVFPNTVYNNINNMGSNSCPSAHPCYTLNHQPPTPFSCNDVGNFFCCAQRLSACSGSVGSTFFVRIHCKSE